jgi:hypothetical protein
MFDSRVRAHLEVETFQKLELALNGWLLLLLVVVFFSLDDYGWFPLTHLAGLTLGLALKARFATADFDRAGRTRHTALPPRGMEVGLWQTLVIAFGGSLSVNLALLALQSLIGAQVSASYLLTYRITALICEIASVPLIIRIPAITRYIAEGSHEAASAMFLKNYRLALILCGVGFTFINTGAVAWNDVMPAGLQLETGIMLAVISMGWFLERIATLRVQLQLSLKNYRVVWVYGVYIVLGLVGVLVAEQAGMPELFSWVLTTSNLLVATVVTLSWRRLRD